MYIEREGKRYELTAEELLEANAEFVTNWMKATLEENFSIPENISQKYAEWAYNRYSEGNGETEYECIELAAKEYEKVPETDSGLQKATCAVCNSCNSGYCDRFQGLVDADSKVADMLRRSGKPVVLAVNKVDNFDKFMPDVYEFYNLGIGDPVPVSAASRLGIGDMLDAVIAHFPEHEAEEKEDERPRVAIVGKPNVGKSSIINKLTGKQRVIVSDVAGTTRDAIDTNVKYNGKDYVFIDTAGLRRKSKIKEELERYSIIRTVTAVERADVVLVVIDATEGVTEQDAKIAGIAHERGKGIIIVVNKWDAIEKNDKTMREYENNVRRVLSFMPYAEIMYVSAETGQRLNKLYDMIDMVIENQTLRVATGVLNEIMTEAVAMQQPPSDKGKRLKLYYITQVAVKPPSFVIFVNNKELMHFSYTRYLENKIREAFGFRGTALKFFIRERKEKDQ